VCFVVSSLCFFGLFPCFFLEWLFLGFVSSSCVETRSKGGEILLFGLKGEVVESCGSDIFHVVQEVLFLEFLFLLQTVWGFFFAFVLFRFEGFVFVLGLKDSSVGFACGGGVRVSEGCEGLHVMLVTWNLRKRVRRRSTTDRNGTVITSDARYACAHLLCKRI
jgi:hypothetical protein